MPGRKERRQMIADWIDRARFWLTCAYWLLVEIGEGAKTDGG